jgi:osmotically-inducible protein OsmY
MIRTDEEIKKAVVDHLFWDSSVDASEIKVGVSEGMVTLTGIVPSHRMMMAAVEDVWSIEGVKEVDNLLIVRFLSSFKPPSDAEIQHNANSLLAWNPDVSRNDIDVLVKGGMVTIEGTVDAYWKSWKVENLLSNLSGVIDVVNHLGVVPTESIIDKEIARYIEEALNRNVYVFAEDVTVKVEHGKVTLIGKVPTWYARWKAFDTAALTPGVTHIDNKLAIT